MRDTLVEVDEDKYDGLWVASASRGTVSWAIGRSASLYLAQLGERDSGGVFQQPAIQPQAAYYYADDDEHPESTSSYPMKIAPDVGEL